MSLESELADSVVDRDAMVEKTRLYLQRVREQSAEAVVAGVKKVCVFYPMSANH